MGQATSLVSGLPRRYAIPDGCNHMGSYACQCKDVVLRDEGRYLALALDIGEHQPLAGMNLGQDPASVD